MSSWVERANFSHRTQLAATALASGALVATSIFTFQRVRRKQRLEDVKASIPDLGRDHTAVRLNQYGGASSSSSTAGPSVPDSNDEDARSAMLAARARAGDWDEELILEQLARNRVFLTDDGLAALRNAFIIIVGCGGVGSHAAAALARSGAGQLRLIDFDQVTLSSLNRHALATLADVGTPKVHCIRRRLEQIVPWCGFDVRNTLFSGKSASTLLGPSIATDEAGIHIAPGRKPDFVIDAIDNIDTKVELLRYCVEHSIPVVSSMGAGCKSDPTRIMLTDISASLEDPLSKATRRRLRMLGISSGITTIWSTEKRGPGKATLQPIPDSALEATKSAANGKVGDLGVLPDFRVRVLPVLGTMPSLFGLAAANHVICSLAKYPLSYVVQKPRPRMYEAVQSYLQGSEERIGRELAGLQIENGMSGIRLPLTNDEIGYVFDEVWGARSVVSLVPTRCVLVRWRPPPAKREDWVTEIEGMVTVKLGLVDLVAMTKEEARWHEKEVLVPRKQPEDIYEKAVIDRVTEALEEEKTFSRIKLNGL